eukprot:756792-Hanusia_phi.AAC.1
MVQRQRLLQGATNRSPSSPTSPASLLSPGLAPALSSLSPAHCLSPKRLRLPLSERRKSNAPLSPVSPRGRHQDIEDQSVAEKRSSWQSGMTTKIPTPREIGWSKYKDTKLDATAQRLQGLDSTRFSRDSLLGSQPRSDILQMTKRVRTLEVQNLFMLNDENVPQSNRSDLSSRFVRKEILPNPDIAGSKFSVGGWGPASKVEFEDYPESMFSPDVSSLLTRYCGAK